jgi:hypothetical protein
MVLKVRPTFSDVAYQARDSLNLGLLTAGSGGVTAIKFVAFANLYLYSINLYQTVLSTSTYTSGGTATVSGQQVSVIVVTNTSTNTATVSLSTATYGPFLAGGSGTAGQVGGVNQYALNTTAGVANAGGINVPVGGYVYAVSGTDATGVTAVTLDYQIYKGAALVE